jgi:hypothetical protein
MTMGHGFLQRDFNLPADLKIETTRLRIVPGTRSLSDAEHTNPSHFSKLLSARIPESWPPDIIPDPAAPTGWWRWYFLIRESPDQESALIGVGGLRGWPAAEGSLQIGCSFLREFRDRGYGTEGVDALTRWALEQVNVKQVFAEICLDNKAAHDVLKKAAS